MPARWSARATAVIGALTLAVPLLVAAPASAAAHTAASVPATTAGASVPAATAGAAPLANLAHLDFLLDTAAPPAGVAGHTTYRLAEEPELIQPWTYADARDGGTFERVGGGPLDPATGTWGQGAFNADDTARAAVVYLRHWRLTGADDSRQTAYELLRSLTYLQTAEGPNAGNVVLWMQPDGTLNPSAEPVELPDPSDSGPSYWLARTIWALGEGYAAFADADPAFAAFLEERLALSLTALQRDVLSRYGQWSTADGMRVPTWLIVDGADASAEAVLGLAARVQARPDDTAAATALRQLAEGIGAMASGTTRAWPYRAILPWAKSPAIWHAWGSQMPAALAAASEALGDPALAAPAIADAAVFTPTLLTAGGPDNGWNPTPTDRVQIAYGADSRVQSLLAVADATGSTAFTELAGIQAAWFFGANHAGTRMYDPATGVTFDGLQPNGDVNRNSGAESTIHGLLTALALDARPDVAQRATSVTEITARDGLEFVEAESTTETNGTLSTPESWTGESGWSGDALTLTRGQRAVFDIGTDATRRWVEPVVWSSPGQRTTSLWRGGGLPSGLLRLTGPEQGISPTPGALLPQSLQAPVLGDRSRLRVDVLSGDVVLDGMIVRPVVSRLVVEGAGGRTELVHSSAALPQPATVDGGGIVRVYDDDGALLRTHPYEGRTTIVLPPGGLAIATR
ncbi:MULTISPECIES: hypothetical protein [Microbacterium]|uniref:Glycogen debranching protein n=1 Tax=Microbacterium wangchenii TaxID=2541726 RepID=A0ABX5SRN3_9MICO|nr:MULTISPECIES: hypothetical protein [Microbacterium]MCK6066621.1 hypothetical protein [Microbacterium sp. EYE_512]QBR87955.1 hypothetical protein E4K62_04140 [Microbacterium wangchenii]TXK18255.1 hypothetical protein FVP99_06660 [Microbacterium wangchenii]